MEEVRLRVLAAGDRVEIARDTAATSTSAWLARETQVPLSQAHRDVLLALALDTDLQRTRDALARGTVHADQARVVVEPSLPEAAVSCDPTLADRAEKHLLERRRPRCPHAEATRPPRPRGHRPGRRRRGAGPPFEAEEQAAGWPTSLEMHDNGDGSHSGRFRLGSLHAAMLRRALGSLHQSFAPAPGDATPPARSRARRSAEWVERRPSPYGPDEGGVNATSW